MTKRIKHGGQLIQQSMQVVRHNKKLIILPLISSLIILVLMAFIIGPVIRYEKAQILLAKGQTHVVIFAYLILLLFLFVTHQIFFHFNAALTHCTNQYFKNNSVSIKEGLKAANQHFFQLYNWNSYAGTVGIFINLFQSILKKLPFYERVFCDLRWNIATYFVIPVIMLEKTGPVQTVKRSANLVRKTWGTNLRTHFGFLPLLLLARFLSLFPLIIGLIGGSRSSIIIGTAITIIFVIIITMISSATRTILACALHRYAAEGVIAPEFSEQLIKKAFVKREN